MFGFLKNKKQEDLKEFSFIWYKQMKTGDATYYTKPFRTKIKAKTREEAKEKLTNYVMAGMKLMIWEEKDFKNADISKIQSDFDNLNKGITDLMELMNSLLTKNK